MKRINVTKTFLPPLEEYITYLHRIWGTGQLTNQGPLLHEFEDNAKKYLNTSGSFHFVSNGTIALQVALRALDVIGGEIITTPFSYVATTSAILWERCKPVFVDIDPLTLCIDASKIEASITADTKAIMAVHVFGNPCDTDRIEAIAKKHNLKVIYDAAHAFGVKYQGKSLLDYGDISTCSFHATKLFHTIEGGCLVVKDQIVSEKVELTKRFGHQFDDHQMLGINAKATEFQAAMGLCNLKYIDEIIKKRQLIYDLYHKNLATHFPIQKIAASTEYNYSYFPLILKNEPQMAAVIKTLSEQEIFPRRYFYPSLNTLPYLDESNACPISEDTAKRIICLPIYPDLAIEDVTRIAEIILSHE